MVSVPELVNVKSRTPILEGVILNVPDVAVEVSVTVAGVIVSPATLDVIVMTLLADNVPLAATVKSKDAVPLKPKEGPVTK